MPMHGETFRFNIDRNFYRQSYDLYATSRIAGSDKVSVALPRRFEVRETPQQVIEPALSLSWEMDGLGMFQSLFDDLWNMGYRPKEKRPELADVEEATAAHVETLRTVAYSLLSKAVGADHFRGDRVWPLSENRRRRKIPLTSPRGNALPQKEKILNAKWRGF